MKKYIQPNTRVVLLQNNAPLCVSTNVYNDKTEGLDGWGSAQQGYSRWGQDNEE